MRSIEDFNAAIDRLKSVITEMEESDKLMLDGSLQICDAQGNDLSASFIDQHKRKIEELKSLIHVIEGKRDGF